MADENSPFQRPITLDSMAARLVVLEAMAFSANAAIVEAMLRSSPDEARAHIGAIVRNIGSGMQTLPEGLREEARSYATMLLGALESLVVREESSSMPSGKKN